MDATPIIIKKRKSHDHAHHGGSWKVAYADFVTAMMAFFMVMWIMGLSEDTKAKIQGYFNDPINFMKSQAHGSVVIAPKSMPISRPGQSAPQPEQMGQPYRDEHKAMQKLRQSLQSDLQKTLGANPSLAGYLKHLDLLITPEGLRLEFKEDRDFFFDTGSAVLKPGALAVIKAIAPQLTASNRTMSIEGHTDSVPFNGDPYGNLLLSTQRAGALAHALGMAGVPVTKIKSANGLGDSQLRDPQHPTSGVNRRVTILLPYTTPLTAKESMPKEDVRHTISGAVVPKVSLKPDSPNIAAGNK
ncbi:MAG TPA: flagellar motor protein MotB [Fimbriimonadaceae bacterium]|nr:flagellar motor protein MotB [Fimbriimonadaceae bacterium]